MKVVECELDTGYLKAQKIISICFDEACKSLSDAYGIYI